VNILILNHIYSRNRILPYYICSQTSGRQGVLSMKWWPSIQPLIQWWSIWPNSGW